MYSIALSGYFYLLIFEVRLILQLFTILHFMKQRKCQNSKMNFKVLATFLLFQQIQGRESVNIQVYYESLCPDSINFITQQLYPTYQALGNYMNIEFIPFGNADVSILDSNIYQDTKPFFPSVHTRFQWGLDI